MAHADHTAQARCNDGMEASSLALAAEASVPLCHDPKAWVKATTSVMWAPGSSRGGANGTSQNTRNPITLISTSEVRSGR